MDSILSFWFPDDKWYDWWFSGHTNHKLNDEIKHKFEKSLIDSRLGLHDILKETVTGTLSLIILFDQFSRHIEKDNPTQRILDDKIGLTLSYHFITFLDDVVAIQTSYLIFGLLPLRHSKNPIDISNLISICNKLESNHMIINTDMWHRFMRLNYRDYYIYCFRDFISCSNESSFVDIIKDYSDVLDPDVKLKWNTDIDISKHELYTVLETSLKKYISVGDKYIGLSLSGGVDSMVMARIMKDFSIKNKLELICVHINYNNRIESIRESEFVIKYCAELDIKLFVIPIEYFKRETTPRNDYELLTRDIRFGFYKYMVSEFKLNVIGLGHHKGDLAENVFTNIVKGGSILDLEVMSELKVVDSVPLWRGLLSVYKDVVFDFAYEFGIPYMKDTTPDWSARGKMRRKWFPSIKDHYSHLDDSLTLIGKQSTMMNELFQKHILKVLIDKIVVCKYGFYIDYSGYENSNIFLWNELLIKICHKYSIKVLSRKRIETIFSKLANTEFSNHSSHCEYNIFTWNNHLVFYHSSLINDDKTTEHIGIDFTTIKNNWKYCVEQYDGDIKSITLSDILNGKIIYTIGCDDDEFIIQKGLPKELKKTMKKSFGNITNDFLNNFHLVIPIVRPSYPSKLVKVSIQKID